MAASDAVSGEALAGPADPPAGATMPAEGARLPDGLCRLCWHDRLVWRDHVWMLDHRGSLDTCTHDCHDHEALLPSTS